MTSHGTRWTTSASREKTPTSPDDSVPRRRSRRAPSAHSAGISESATARATRTTETPAALTARMNGISRTTSPASEMATMSAENTMVRPARSMVVATAPTTCSRVALGDGGAVEEGAHLLAEAAHDEQAVVDAQAEAEHGDDVDDGGVEVEDVGEAPAATASAPAIDATAPNTGNPAARKPPNTTTMTSEAHRQRDALAALAVGLDLLDDPVDEGRAGRRAAHRWRRCPRRAGRGRHPPARSRRPPARR